MTWLMSLVFYESDVQKLDSLGSGGMRKTGKRPLSRFLIAPRYYFADKMSAASLARK
jgi:hypothetical protein